MDHPFLFSFGLSHKREREREAGGKRKGRRKFGEVEDNGILVLPPKKKGLV